MTKENKRKAVELATFHLLNYYKQIENHWTSYTMIDDLIVMMENIIIKNYNY